MTELRNNADEKRFEALEDGAVVGFAAYQLTDEVIVFTHTEVDPGHEGKGIGSAIARYALDEVRHGHRRVLPLCPFIKSWIFWHVEYADLLYGAPKKNAKD